MNTPAAYTFTLHVRDEPDLPVRIAQIFARRAGVLRSIAITPAPGDLQAKIIVDAMNVIDPEHIRTQLEKLIYVHRVDFSAR